MKSPMSNGIVIGVVVDLEDEQNLGRIRVEYPHLTKGTISEWARVATPLAGPGYGFYAVPDKGTEVLMAFEHGDPRRPYVLGGLWSQPDSPPEVDPDQAKNNWRLIRSRSGHVIKFDDTEGAEKIEIIDKDESRKMILDSTNSKIEIVCIEGDVSVQAGQGMVTVEAGDVTIKGKNSVTLEASGKMTIKGNPVHIN